MTLRSTEDTSWWYLPLAAGGTQEIGRVDVRDSNATNGQLLLPRRHALDSGHNVNWFFSTPRGTIFLVQ